MEMEQRSNYLQTKFSLDNIKRQKEPVLHNSATFAGYDLIGFNKNILTKTYYDTPDLFLHNAGISINVNTLKGSKTSELVVRWDSGHDRIKFLSNMPDAFSLIIPSKDSIYKYTDSIARSISELVPQGQGIDPVVIASSIRKIFTVKKTRESYRYIHISGCKITLDFSNCEYISNINRAKQKLQLLEITSETLSKADEYETFIKRISFNNTQLIKTHSSDVKIAKEYNMY